MSRQLKLYTVTVKYDFVVVAEDLNDAYEVGLDYAREALSDLNKPDLDLDVVPGALAYRWDDECIPYGGDGNTRTGEYK